MIDLNKQLRRNCHILPRFVLRCLGISVNDNESKLYKIYSYVMIITGSLFPWTSCHLISQNLDKYDVIISGMFNVVGGSAAFLIIISIKYNAKRLQSIFKTLEELQIKWNKERWGENDLYKINRLTNSLISERKKYQHLQEVIKRTVKHHLTLINVTNELKIVGSNVLLITAIASICIMTFSLYYASVLPMLSTAALLSYFEVSAVSSTLFMLSYFGTQLATASEDISNTLYEMDFVGLDIRFQKSLLLIIMRSQKPSWLTIGGFTNLSISVYAWVLRTTYSYVMILRKNSQVKENHAF
ncbi:hypothetical protein FQR65_LT18911 [Abscondita terminalis]|nr:hypothetical protein FQR65_LT18911 [Abscondita terminalis]